MVLFNYSTKEITAKIVYYGPGLCGKTTNLQFIYDDLPETINKGKMLSLATKTDRTLFFDFLPLDLGTIRGMRTRLQLYTVPGQVFYNTTRKLVLKGADGIIFVADSQKSMLEANIESFRNLEQNLQEYGVKLDEIPLVVQFNKRDLPEVASIEDLNAAVNRHNVPIYEAVATTGIGVHETLKACTRLVLNSLKSRYAEDRPRRAAVATAAMGSTTARVETPPAPEASATGTAASPPVRETVEASLAGAAVEPPAPAIPVQHAEPDLVPLNEDLEVGDDPMGENLQLESLEPGADLDLEPAEEPEAPQAADRRDGATVPLAQEEAFEAIRRISREEEDEQAEEPADAAPVRDEAPTHAAEVPEAEDAAAEEDPILEVLSENDEDVHDGVLELADVIDEDDEEAAVDVRLDAEVHGAGEQVVQDEDAGIVDEEDSPEPVDRDLEPEPLDARAIDDEDLEPADEEIVDLEQFASDEHAAQVDPAQAGPVVAVRVTRMEGEREIRVPVRLTVGGQTLSLHLTISVTVDPSERNEAHEAEVNS